MSHIYRIILLLCTRWFAQLFDLDLIILYYIYIYIYFRALSPTTIAPSSVRGTLLVVCIVLAVRAFIYAAACVIYLCHGSAESFAHTMAARPETGENEVRVTRGHGAANIKTRVKKTPVKWRKLKDFVVIEKFRYTST